MHQLARASACFGLIARQRVSRRARVTSTNVGTFKANDPLKIFTWKRLLKEAPRASDAGARYLTRARRPICDIPYPQGRTRLDHAERGRG